MATNSIRETIILQVIEELKTISSISEVRRVRPSLTNLSTFSSAQFPLIAIESSLPLPVQKISNRIPGGVDLFISELTIRVFCYAMDNEDPDSTISDLADDIWKKVYEDPLHNDLCLCTNVIPKIETAIWHPYVAFGFEVLLQYKHTTGGI
jgi:hypothetical protein